MGVKNTANQFPFEALASQLNRNDYNYNSILNGLVEWNDTTKDFVVIRLTTDESPYYQDYVIPSKKVIEGGNVMSATTTGSTIRIPVNFMSGDVASIEISVASFGDTDWTLSAIPTINTSSEILIQEVIKVGTDDSTNISFSYNVPEPIKFIQLKPNGDAVGAEISVLIRLKEIIPDTPYNKSVGVYENVNTVLHPLDVSPVWSSTDSGTEFFRTDDSLPITNRQKYSASMIFEHGKRDTKTVNFINYNGPDLDQGLCIYLPVLSGGSKPKDGYSFEFNFRIYPDTSYTRTLTADHIINKAQIYVYSIPEINSIDSDIYPIARFSMARMLNYHIWAENISIPDKPVSYYAQFIYSSLLDSWTLLTFNQLDDHVLYGPYGFVDPLSFSNSKLTQFQSYESSALPTYTDPFTTLELKRYTNEDINNNLTI